MSKTFTKNATYANNKRFFLSLSSSLSCFIPRRLETSMRVITQQGLNYFSYS